MTRLIPTLVLTLLSLSTLGGCQTNPSTGRSQLILVSSEQTREIGEAAKPELIEQYGGEVQSAALRTYITGVGQRLARVTEPDFKDIKWEFITLDSDVINAFALPGGKVFITRGILSQFNNEAEVAAVLGHEIGHVTGKHVDERISQATVLQTGAQLGGALSRTQITSIALNLFSQGYLLKFSREQESEADMQGLKYMTRAGYNPEGMIQVLQVLAEASKGNRTPEMLATHPDPERRLNDVQAKIDKDYRDELNNPKYELFENRFQSGAKPYLGAAPKSSTKTPKPK